MQILLLNKIINFKTSCQNFKGITETANKMQNKHQLTLKKFLGKLLDNL